MTEENFNYRTSPFLLRNQFKGTGIFKIPIIPKAQFSDVEFQDLLLIGFDRTNLENNNNLDRMVHFFLYDYKFERVWKNPDTDIEKLKRYRAVLSPDFSMYLEMSPTMQLYNTFRNRWCGAYFASKGIRVIPTVSWGDESTFDFCFDGIEKGSTVAVSTYMVSEHNNHADQKEFFLNGYNEMLRRIEPEKVICYNQPFSEMQGNIIFVDYELSSWKYQNDEYVPSKYIDYILGNKALPNGSNIIIKTGIITRDDTNFKGMGSAYGGKWKPKKPEDERFMGKPGETKTTYKNGYKIDTKIGEDGYATKERHYTDHNKPWAHTNPHDHYINWKSPKPGIPNFEKPNINYTNEIPEFKYYKETNNMNISSTNSFEDSRFKTISDFKDCMIRGGEVEFIWEGKVYNISHYDGKISISEAYKQETEKLCDTDDEVLEYMLDGELLRNIISKVEVIDRTI